MPTTTTPWGTGLPWYEIMQDITKVSREYRLKMPKNWQDGDWPSVFRDWGFAPVDPKGEWWTAIPEKPNLPLAYAPLATISSTVGAIEAGQTTTALIETASPIIDLTYTEIGGETVATATTSGVFSSVSSAVATGAVGAAIGFGVGVGIFETAPEFCTKVSNAVFGTDLDPEEIGQMARDTNALVVIKDGLVYMAEDMINAIRNAFFDNGAADESIIYPSIDNESIPVTITSQGDVQELGAEYIDILKNGKFRNTEYQANWEEFLEYHGYGALRIQPVYRDGALYRLAVDIAAGDISQYLPLDTTAFKTKYGDATYYVCPSLNMPVYYYGNFYLDIGATYFDGPYSGWGFYKLENTTGSIYYGEGTPAPDISINNRSSWFSSLNTTTRGVIDGITPTGNQGTKDQPIATLFPDWYAKGIETIAGDGVTKVRWLPVSLPATNPLVSGNPFATDKAQEGTMPDNYTDTANQLGEQTEEATKNAPDYPAPPIAPVPDVTPTPSDPSISGGGGSATGLANLYNPTLAQVKEFSRWLWGSDGLNLDQLKKLLQDPMQAIIGLHVMYATPTTGAERGIQVGYINSGVNSKIVTEQYTEIDCGTVTINEYFGDARDYSPFTQVYCYLPFIGIVELNADDVVNSTLGIKYKIDVLTGCCLAQLTVKKYGLDAVLYTYTGNCAVQMPITSGNYLSTVSSLLGAVVSGAAAVATGGALAPVAIGAAANALGGGARASVAMSGSLGSNAGAMGIRKPYLIIKRVEQADANGYNEFYGYPTNKRVKLSQLSGYVRVKDINLLGTNATEEEQNEIVALLREGVIL